MFKDKLRELRIRNKYSMDDLAELYNKKFGGRMNKSTLSRYENGLQEPMISVVKNLADLFDVTLDYLTDDKKTPPLEMSESAKLKYGLLASIIDELSDDEWEKLKDYASLLIKARQNRKDDQ